MLREPLQSKNINFFITSDTFPSISVTGSSCSLRCKHCEGKLLERLTPATTCEEIERKGHLFNKRGAKGILLTGGCDDRGRVPIKKVMSAVRNLRLTTDLIIIAHTGFISREEADLLKESGLAGIGFDVMGDMSSVFEVYGFRVSENEYMDSLRAIKDSGLLIFPHVCVGIHFGKLRGEYRALEMIRSIEPTTVIITGLMPVAGTPMQHIKPVPSDFEKVISRAKELFHDIPVVLGCAHSSGKDRAKIEKIALLLGISGIAAPTMATVEYARENKYEINFYGTCCGLIPNDSTRIELQPSKF